MLQGYFGLILKAATHYTIFLLEGHQFLFAMKIGCVWQLQTKPWQLQGSEPTFYREWQAS